MKQIYISRVQKMLNPIVWLVKINLFIISHSILHLIGWKHPDQVTKNILKNQDKAIVIYPHTSNWDFIITLLYRFSSPEVLSDMTLVVKPQLFKYPLINKYVWEPLNLLPASSLENPGLGFINSTYDSLKSKFRYKLFISPKGKRDKSHWRSGYYWLAKKLEVDIILVGLDYTKKTYVVYPPYKLDDYKNITQFEILLKHKMSSIIPLYPECELMIQNYSSVNKSVVDWILVSSWLSSIYPLYLLYFIDLPVFIFGCSCIVSSHLYHFYEERNHFYRVLDVSLTLISALLYLIRIIYLKRYFEQVNGVFNLLLFITLYFYIEGCGREKVNERTLKYYTHHIFFHVLCGITSSYLLF